MAGSSDRQRRSRGTARAVARAVAAAVAAVLLWWAYAILDNIWNYNDSGTLSYVGFAAIPGIPGLLAGVFALRGRLRP
jgi:hypothetical protein